MSAGWSADPPISGGATRPVIQSWADFVTGKTSDNVVSIVRAARP
jgi:hypothetical protein